MNKVANNISGVEIQTKVYKVSITLSIFSRTPNKVKKATIINILYVEPLFCLLPSLPVRGMVLFFSSHSQYCYTLRECGTTLQHQPAQHYTGLATPDR